MRILAFLLVPVFVFPEFLAISGFELGKGPFASLKITFSTDYPNLRSLAEFDLNVSFFGGNIFFQSEDLSDSVKFFQLDLGSVQLSYGWLKADFPFPGTVYPEEWLLRLGETYVVLSKNSRMWVKIGPLFVESGMNERSIGALLGFDDLGAGYDVYNGKILLRLGPMIYELSKKSMGISLYRKKIVVSFNGRDLYVFLWNKNGYLQIDREKTKFLEKVGSIYVVGKLSEREKKLGIGVQF